MKINLEIARICFEANKQYCKENKLFYVLDTWDELPSNIKESIVDGVQKVKANPKVTAKEMHDNWLKYKKADGWKFGKTNDAVNKTHPNMVPFEKLSKEEQFKDKLFIKTVKAEIAK